MLQVRVIFFIVPLGVSCCLSLGVDRDSVLSLLGVILWRSLDYLLKRAILALLEHFKLTVEFICIPIFNVHFFIQLIIFL